MKSFLLATLLALVASMNSPIFVLEPPPKVYVSGPKGVHLRCAALGTPAPQIIWVDSGGDPITQVSNVREILPNGTLWLGAKPGHNSVSRTTYRCKAKNSAGTAISRSSTVTVVIGKNLSPSVESSPTRVGGVAILRCLTKSGIDFDAITVQWFMKKTSSSPPMPIPNAGRYIYGHRGILYLLEVSESDAPSQFICKVSPRGVPTSPVVYGQTAVDQNLASRPQVIKVLAPPSVESSPQIDTSLQTSVHVAEGDPFTIPCISLGTPQPKYSWMREGLAGVQTITTLNNMYGIDMTASSELWARGPILGSNRARDTHKGAYTCVVANAKGTDRLVYEINILQELKVAIVPKFQTVSAGGKAIIRCTIYGSPVAEVKWYKNGRLLHSTNRIVVRDREVIINGASESDVGVYQCMAANTLGETQAETYISIRDSAPQFAHKFIEQILQPGPSVTLTCEALGHPMPSVSWLRDGRPISSHSERFSSYRLSIGSWINTSGHVVSQVNISSITIMDGGLYQCEAANSVGRISHSSRLNVYGPPSTRSPANLTAISKREAILPCPITGYPLGDTQWMIDNRPLTRTQRRFVTPEGRLHIAEVEASQDSKRYTCSVRTSQGVSASASFFLNVLNPPILANFKFPDNLFVGMKLSVICSLMEGDVPVTIRWSREDGASLNQDTEVSQVQNQFFSNLIFTDVQARHAGPYSCTASNEAASSTITSVMNVKVPPSWIVAPTDLEVVAGEDVVMECHSAGTPMPTVSWKRPQGDKSISDSPDITGDGWRVSLPRKGTLKIRSVSRHDAGKYICHAQNGVSPALSEIIHLQVLEKAKINGAKVANKTVGVGSKLEIRCDADGALPLYFAWSHNGAPIMMSDTTILDIHTETSDVSSILSLKSSNRLHAGLYTCQVANKYGTAIKSIFVNVVEKPDHPAHVHVVRVTSRHISLAWAQPFDGNSPLIHYVGLIPGTQYNLDVLAVNSIGSSVPSPTLSITTQQEPPVEPPILVLATPLSRGTIQVSWKTPTAEFTRQITGYHVGYRVARYPGKYKWRFVRQSGLTAEIRGLTDFTEYEVTARAFNAVGAGPPAQSLSVTTKQAEPSASPSNIECTSISSQTLRIRWSPLRSNESRGPIQGYNIYYKKLSRYQGSHRVQIKNTTNLETNLQGLEKFTNYSLRMLAYNIAGEGKLSEVLECSTLADKPGTPTSIKALVKSVNSVSVSWLEPRRPNGVIIRYTIYHRPLNSHYGVEHMNVERSSFSDLPRFREISTTIDSLENHKHYEFWVTASTTMGEGSTSTIVPQSPKDTVPARIASFGQNVEAVKGESLSLPCSVIGFPPPSVSWTPQLLVSYR